MSGTKERKLKKPLAAQPRGFNLGGVPDILNKRKVHWKVFWVLRASGYTYLQDVSYRRSE